MTTQPVLFDAPLPREIRDVPVGEWAGKARTSDPTTSQDAARTITGKTERLLLQHFRYGGPPEQGWTADELCHELPAIFPPTLKSALSRLVNHKLIKPTGETRLSDRGCAQTVWKIAEKEND